MNKFRKIYKKIRWSLRSHFIGRKMINNIKNKDFTIIASDCIGGMIYNDLKMQFLSPTINLYFEADDFIKFISDMKYWLEQPMIEVPQDKLTEKYDFPVAQLGEDGIRLYLVHYGSFEDAKDKWNKRKDRINWDNIYYIMNDRNNFTKKNLEDFDKLPTKKKVLFTHIPYEKYKSTYYIKGYEDKEYLGSIIMFKSPFSIKRSYDQFDFVKWFNQ